jgi:hypothetical protein
MGHRTVVLSAIAGVAAAVAALASPAGAVAAAPVAQQLIKAYSPIQMLRSQEEGICDNAEEQFQPQPVETVLGNPRVSLQRYENGKTQTVVGSAPTAAQIAGLGDDYYLNLPGDPLNAECEYATDFAKLKADGKAPPTTYAHIAREQGQPGFVIQYWFYYYFNQFNDVHEGDWEGMQIAFDADTPAQALADGPSKIALFQHGGGQVSDWDDDLVEKEDTHPIVYPAAGSHATFHEPAIFVENGQGGAGLGCDNTTEPLRRLDPSPVTVPTGPAKGSRFQWLTYEGHWGQREPGFNTGPTGPSTKTQWLEPFTWMDKQRLAAPRLPGGTLLGPTVTAAFCGTVAGVSDFVNFQQQSTFAQILLIAGGLALLALLAFLITRTRWRPVELEPLRQRRWFGQLIGVAARFYARHWKVLLPIALLALLALGAVELLAYLAQKLAGDGEIGGVFGPAGVQGPAQDLIKSLGRPVGEAVIGGALVSVLFLVDQGRSPSVPAAFRLTLPRLLRLVFGYLAVVVMTTGLAITVIGLPWAVKKYVDWSFLQQEILFRDRSIRDGLRASTDAVRGSWWWTVRVLVFFYLIGVITGPILTFGLVFANFSLTAIDLTGSVVFALLLPYVIAGKTLLWLDLQSRERVPAPAGRRVWWQPWSWARRPAAQPS